MEPSSEVFHNLPQWEYIWLLFKWFSHSLFNLFLSGYVSSITITFHTHNIIPSIFLLRDTTIKYEKGNVSYTQNFPTEVYKMVGLEIKKEEEEEKMYVFNFYNGSFGFKTSN